MTVEVVTEDIYINCGDYSNSNFSLDNKTGVFGSGPGINFGLKRVEDGYLYNSDKITAFTTESKIGRMGLSFVSGTDFISINSYDIEPYGNSDYDWAIDYTPINAISLTVEPNNSTELREGVYKLFWQNKAMAIGGDTNVYSENTIHFILRGLNPTYTYIPVFLRLVND